MDANFGVIRATIDRLLDGFLATLPLLVAAILIFALLLLGAKSVRHLAEKAMKRSSNGDDLSQVKAISLEAIKRVNGVLADPAPDVLVWELRESAKNIRIRWWTNPARADVQRIRDGVLREVAEAINGAGMDLPFPTQVVLFHDQTEETDGDRTRQREGWPAGKNPQTPHYLPQSRAAADGNPSG